MSATTIEWTERTWNPIVGCSPTSPGCAHCYAMPQAARVERMLPRQWRSAPLVPNHYAGLTMPSKAGPVWTGRVSLAPDHIVEAPLRRRKPTVWFVNSMGDLFHPSVPDAWIARVFAVMACAPQHTFQALTKQAARMRRWATDPATPRSIARAVLDMAAAGTVTGAAALAPLGDRDRDDDPEYVRWPLPNVWKGVSAEDQTRADERIPHLLATPAAVRFVSCEPLLGPINLTSIAIQHGAGKQNINALFCEEDAADCGQIGAAALDWVIAGGESGRNARPMHPDWARSLRDQCAAGGVSYFFKQWGEWAPVIGAIDWYEIDDDPEISRFDHLEWEGGRWTGPFRPMWCDFQDGNYDDEQCVSRIGKARAGRLLDGRTHDDVPLGTRRAA